MSCSRARPWALCAGAVLTGLAAGGPASAANWIVTVGGRVSASPPYEGAPNDDIRPSFAFNLRKTNHPYRFSPPDGGNSVALISTRYVVAGPVVRFRYSRDDTGRLEGFRKIDFAVEPGLFVDLWPADWLRMRVEVRRGVLGHAGVVGDAGIDYIYTGRKWDFSIGPRVGYGDRRYIDTYFGVTQQEANRSPLLDYPYEPGGGWRYGGLEAAFSYHITDRLWTTIDVGYHRLANVTAASPVVSIAGSRNQYLGGIGLTYSFPVQIGKRR
jgi:outer membrane scaffolding protein for murein synthesis (MipA/OmpV family)